ncbi:hypothetical protein EDB82DRAFT_2720 [Fusarium venenatum]|uniref:uncharacterized protein n=1 Tax=Fusarium venenatum TaxID=56646 RepID=UPI001D2AE030|nr:hypothetical protein EDB82DRAFT_2720 [Fusarium venenatum]
MAEPVQLPGVKPTTVGGLMSFLDFPGEIRNNIYEILLLHSDFVDPWYPVDHYVSLNPLFGYISKYVTGLFRVNKIAHREASLLFYSHNRFNFTEVGAEAIASFLQQIGTRNASFIRHIIIDFPEFSRLEPGNVTIEVESARSLGKILSSCTGLNTVETSLRITSSREHELESLDNHGVAVEALDLIDTHFRSITSLSEIIIELCEYTPENVLRSTMEGCGWVLRTRRFFYVHDWDDSGGDEFDEFGDDYDDDSNSYDDDDYDIDNDSDFWRRAAD